jgi:hypothetical protein
MQSSTLARLCAIPFIGFYAYAQSGPPPIPPLQSVTAMGIVTQDPLVQGRDGTYSALIDGESVWAFDDTTLTQNNASGTNFFSNSLAWTTNLDASSGITLNGNHVDSSGAPAEFMPFLPWETAYNTAHDSNKLYSGPVWREYRHLARPSGARSRAEADTVFLWRDLAFA